MEHHYVTLECQLLLGLREGLGVTNAARIATLLHQVSSSLTLSIQF